MRTILLTLLFPLSSFALTVSSGEHHLLDTTTLEAEEIIIEKGGTLELPRTCEITTLKAKKIVIEGKILGRSCNKPYVKEVLGNFLYEVSSKEGTSGSPSTAEGFLIYGGGKSAFGNGGGGGSDFFEGDDASYGFSGSAKGIGGSGGRRGTHGQGLILDAIAIEGKGTIDLRGIEGDRGDVGKSYKTQRFVETLLKEVCVEPSSKGTCSHFERRSQVAEKMVVIEGGKGGDGSSGSGGAVLLPKGFKGKIEVEGAKGKIPGVKGRVYEK